MRKAIGSIAIITLFLFSCKKEKSFDPNNPNGGGGGSTDSLLEKTVTQTDGGDSLVITYIYDSQKKFIGYSAEESYQGDFYHREEKFIRNSQGIIQKIVVKSFDLALLGIDSVFYAVHYNTSTSRYTSSVLTYDDGIDFFKDS